MKIITIFVGVMIVTIGRVYSQENTYYGVGAGTGGSQNSRYGFETGKESGSTSYNTSIGANAMHNNTNDWNTAVGEGALYKGGNRSTAIGT